MLIENQIIKKTNHFQIIDFSNIFHPKNSKKTPLSPDGRENPFLNLTGFRNLLGLKKIVTDSRNMETKKAQTIRFKTKNPTAFKNYRVYL